MCVGVCVCVCVDWSLPDTTQHKSCLLTLNITSNQQISSQAPYPLRNMMHHYMLLQSIYVLYSNVNYIYPISCLVEIKLFQKLYIQHQLFTRRTILVCSYIFIRKEIIHG